jgi:hypothetical protein
MKTSIFLGAFFALTVLAFGQQTKIDLHHEGYFNMPDYTAKREAIFLGYDAYAVKDSTWYTYDTSYVFAAVAHPTRHEYSELRLIPAISIGRRECHLVYGSPIPETFKFYYLFSRKAGQQIKEPVLMAFPLPTCDLTKHGDTK